MNDRELEPPATHTPDLSRAADSSRIATAPAAAESPSLSELEALREALLSIEKQIGRVGREQFKANNIAEAQATQLSAAIEQLRTADARREAELAALRERSRGALVAARLEVVQAILPALDGLDEALRSGNSLLVAPAESDGDDPDADEHNSSGGWLQRLFGLAPPAQPAESPEASELRAALHSWLTGLGFVRQRLLDALAGQGVRPLTPLGQPFDPQYHIAVDVVPADEDYPEGSVVEELRRGYLAGERVLRHAEVIVATAEGQTQEEYDE